jgi:hypothetical protein
MEAKGVPMSRDRDLDEFGEFAAWALRDLRRTAYLRVLDGPGGVLSAGGSPYG